MSHEFESGFSVRRAAWHNLATVLDDYPTDWNDARQKAGLMWEPYEVPIFVQDGERRIAGHYEPMFRPMETDEKFKLIARDDNNKILASVSEGFGLFPNSEMGELLEVLLDTEADKVKFETAGSLKGGRTVWALAYLDEPFVVNGDTTETFPYMALINPHDGSGALKALNTNVRIVCKNTVRMAEAEGERTGREFSFRHTSTIRDRVADAREALSGARNESAKWLVLANELSLIPISTTQFNHFLSEFIPEPPAGVVSDRVRENVSKARSIFKHLYLDSVTTEGIRGTAYGLFNASTEYLDHCRGFRNQDTYLARTLLRQEPMKAKAMKLIREVVKSG